MKYKWLSPETPENGYYIVELTFIRKKDKNHSRYNLKVIENYWTQMPYAGYKIGDTLSEMNIDLSSTPYFHPLDDPNDILKGLL